ncbi:hypothetical protein PoB_003488800 [Plakobranchus ocellatus]|uniref:Uncharacterized protein n=1 Tax=Plakobranchus ocellatus TaxID=259542 RepID=A0AAV4APA2_9GAST|nr:hypothetical protein PoB_003488800 [Plakobranchus ocellatus]
MNHSEDLEQLYEQLQTVMDSVKKRNLISTMDRFDAKVRKGLSKHQGIGLRVLEEGEHLFTILETNGINDDPRHSVSV